MMETLMELIAKIFIGSWFVSVILHIGAGIRYGCLWLFRRGQEVSYRQIRYGSEDFNNIDHADNNLANGFLGFFILAVIIVLIAK
ncbi:hypothetical protein [Bacteroides acidifaciens]|uniref:hypothetical protein n=1 Tax=Bacteroides acidifaciens TaxID=85831 RepID=UPI002613548D|nr:hypothetical protein [Bacteroides acidifaciens]